MVQPAQISLFSEPNGKLTVEPASLLKGQLGARLGRLANEQNCYVGASSWKYTGWLGEMYDPLRYMVSGRFSKQHFEERCLTEYAESFPAVCGDFAFYQFPSDVFWQRLFAQVPANFQFAFKVPEDITLPYFPKHARYGLRSAQVNGGFLSVERLEAEFLSRLRSRKANVGVLIFEFGASVTRAFDEPKHFLKRLQHFLARLPGNFRYAVEVRDARLLCPEYFSLLVSSGVAHVLNSWTGMPPLNEQLERGYQEAAPFRVVRALLKPGRSYAEAVKLFAPYDRVRESNFEVRQALRDLLLESKRRAEPLYIFVNNRLEGFAPGTILAVLDAVDGHTQ